ncbi:MAG: FHA domain-containing protein [Bacteriovoracaceae bacterium]|jgi:predicted component of type VI protein secretion system
MKLDFRLITGQEVSHELKKTSFVIGRSPHCDVVVPFEGFSRKHCQVDLSPEGDVYLTDLDSANGVLIDGKKIPPLTKTVYNTLLPLVVGPAEVTIELEAPSILKYENMNSASNSLISKASENVSRTSTRSASSSKPLKPVKKKFDFKSIGAIALVIIGFFVYKEIKNFMSGAESEDEEIYKMQFEAQMKGKSNDGSIKTKDF